MPLLVGNYIDLAREHQVILQLVCGVEAIAKESRKIAFSLLPSSFDDVCRYGHRGPNNLAPQGCVARFTDPHRGSMSVKRKCMCLLPHYKLLEIAHPEE